MAHSTRRRALGMIVGAVLLGACTVKEQETPPLTGPSELSTAINISVTPDTLSQDGASQSLVTITARDHNGQPLRSLPLQAAIAVNGVLTDFGTLSARSLVTDANGRATLTYTAPAAPPIAVDTGTVVQILVTPTGNDFGNATARFASIRLVPRGVITPPNNLTAVFDVTRPDTTEDSTILFDATKSDAANPNTTLVSYQWDFGNGDTASGRQVTRKLGPGNRTVTLTVTDVAGRTGTSQQVITVASGTRPTAVSPVVSPIPPTLGQPVHFDASGSFAAPGHRIVSYTWNFGEGTIRTTSEPRTDFVYTVGGRTYVVLLTVTDETGKTSQTPATVNVSFP
jgi:hypothetical protein